MHVYVANVDKERSHDVFGRGRPGQLHNTLTHRHMVTLHEYFLAEDDVPSHYFSQVRLALHWKGSRTAPSWAACELTYLCVFSCSL